ncbi:MAG: VCBS repeat-containing protein, partial [Bacteroidales bacterium]|nr:VCBS repeat-containing protein [Bacteroidales bacterium]
MKTLKLTSFILLAFLLLSLKTGDIKSEYKVPFVNSVTSNDFDLDGDIDLIFGHNYNFTTEWGGISFLENLGYGYYSLLDSVFIYGNQTVIYSTDIIGDEYPDIISQFYDGQQSNAAIIEINNGNYDISYHPMCNHLTDFNYGDISGNDAIDFAFISNNDFLWGIIYNDGTGNFSTPEYFDLSFPPVDIACADLNNDGRADVVLCGSTTEIYFSTETGFQQQILTTTLSHDILITDFDNDGDNDIITHTTFIYPNHRVYMFENLGNNQFIEHDYFQFSPFCSYGQIADFNNDSLPDMIFIDWDHSELIIYTNVGGFQLEYDQNIDVDNLGYQLGSLDCNDFDGNGFND